MGLVGRSDKVAFYGIAGESETTYHRMTGFTEMSVTKNPKEYSRQYIDEAFEQTDVTGYSPSIAYAFDQYSENEVHTDLAAIADEEKVGTDAVRDIVIVDMTKAGKTSGAKAAQKRSYAVIPDSEGGSTDAYTYSGAFRTKGGVILGEATSNDDWQTVTFTVQTA